MKDFFAASSSSASLLTQAGSPVYRLYYLILGQISQHLRQVAGDRQRKRLPPINVLIQMFFFFGKPSSIQRTTQAIGQTGGVLLVVVEAMQM